MPVKQHCSMELYDAHMVATSHILVMRIWILGSCIWGTDFLKFNLISINLNLNVNRHMWLVVTQFDSVDKEF